jgi:hypothetical protein
MKVGVAEPEEMVIARHGTVNTFPWQPTHVTTVTDMHTTIEELLEAVVSVWVHAKAV